METVNIDQLLKAATILEEMQTRRLGEGMNEMDLRSLITTMRAQHNSVGSSSSSPLRPSPAASTMSSTSAGLSPRRRSAPTKHSRVAHNELEKTRRANLRFCLEKLKELVPPGTDAARNTTLALLTRGRDHLMDLDVMLTEEQGKKALLEIRRDQLRQQLAELQAMDKLEEEKRAEEVKETKVDASPSTSSTSARSSPFLVEYSPSNKPMCDLLTGIKASLPTTPTRYQVDPILDGLVPAVPICFPRPYASFEELLRLACHSMPSPLTVDLPIGSH